MTTISPLATLPASSRHPSPKPSPGLLSSVAIATAFIMLATLVLFSTGCTTTATDRAAKSLASTVQSVDVAMKGFTTAVAMNVVALDDQAKARKLYADYQAAVALAETAITNAINSGDAGSLAAATAALDASKFQLLAFLARFTNAPPQ